MDSKLYRLLNNYKWCSSPYIDNWKSGSNKIFIGVSKLDDVWIDKVALVPKGSEGAMTDPMDADTDLDNLVDGEELNSGQIIRQTYDDGEKDTYVRIDYNDDYARKTMYIPTTPQPLINVQLLVYGKAYGTSLDINEHYIIVNGHNVYFNVYDKFSTSYDWGIITIPVYYITQGAENTFKIKEEWMVGGWLYNNLEIGIDMNSNYGRSRWMSNDVTNTNGELMMRLRLFYCDENTMTDPMDPDTDGDDLRDGNEIYTYNTDPMNSDTDNDGYNDGRDIDPLIDLEVSVKIIRGKAIDNTDGIWSDPDLYVVVKINGEEHTSPTYSTMDKTFNLVYTKDVPDDNANVLIDIQLWDDDTGFGDDGTSDAFDIVYGSGGLTLDLTYNLRTGSWSGDDYMGDSDGYGYSSGDGDGLVEDSDGAIWFDVWDTGDTDNDGLTYWEEVNLYGTDPTVNDWTVDSDRDGMSNAWEIEYGLNHKSSVGDNGADGDPDQDGITNIKEYEMKIDPTVNNDRYAILVAPVRQESESQYKYDITQMRIYLLAQGWNDNNIIFLTTTDYNQNNGNPEPYIDGDATHDNLQEAFDAIKDGGTHFGVNFGYGADMNDIVFIEFRDHGSLDDGRSSFCTYSDTDKGFTKANYWYDDEIGDELDDISCLRLILEVDTCHSGGFIDDCNGPNRLIITSQTEQWVSYRFAYKLYERIIDINSDGCIGIDTNGDIIRGTSNGLISVEEAHYYAAADCWDRYENNTPQQHPQIDDQIAGETYL